MCIVEKFGGQTCPIQSVRNLGIVALQVIIQDDTFTQSRISTIIVVVITSNTQLAEAPGNVLLPCAATGLPRDSVANVSQIFTIDKTFLVERVGAILEQLQVEVDEGLRTVLYL